MRWYDVRNVGLPELRDAEYVKWVEPLEVIGRAFKAGEVKPHIENNVIIAPRSTRIDVPDPWGRMRSQIPGNKTPRYLSMHLYQLTDAIVLAVGSWLCDYTGRQAGAVWYYVRGEDGQWANERGNNRAVREAMNGLKVMSVLQQIKVL